MSVNNAKNNIKQKIKKKLYFTILNAIKIESKTEG